MLRDKELIDRLLDVCEKNNINHKNPPDRCLVNELNDYYLSHSINSDESNKGFYLYCMNDRYIIQISGERGGFYILTKEYENILFEEYNLSDSDDLVDLESFVLTHKGKLRIVRC